MIMLYVQTSTGNLFFYLTISLIWTFSSSFSVCGLCYLTFLCRKDWDRHRMANCSCRRSEKQKLTQNTHDAVCWSEKRNRLVLIIWGVYCRSAVGHVVVSGGLVHPARGTGHLDRRHLHLRLHHGRHTETCGPAGALHQVSRRDASSCDCVTFDLWMCFVLCLQWHWDRCAGEMCVRTHAQCVGILRYWNPYDLTLTLIKIDGF